MTALLRRQMRQSPYVWTLLAVVVALVVLLTRGAGLVLVLVAVSVERGVAVVVTAAGWADEYVSGRAGLPPLAGIEAGRIR